MKGGVVKEGNIRPLGVHKEYQKLFKKDIVERFDGRRGCGFMKCERCVNCGRSGAKKVLEGKYIFHECGACGTLFLSPRPTYKIMEDYLKNSESMSYFVDNIRDKTEKNRIRNILIPRLNLLKGLLGNEFAGIRNLLEIGSGSGAFLQVIRSRTHIKDVIGNEVFPPSIDRMRRLRIDVLPGIIEKVETDISVDLVVTCEVIAHVPDPLNFLKKCNRLLKKDGYLFMTTPNINSLEYRLFYDKMGLEDNPTQMNFFNVDTVDLILKRAGLEVVSKLTPGDLDADIILRKLVRRRCDPDLIERFQASILSNNLSSHMAVLARERRDIDE